MKIRILIVSTDSAYLERMTGMVAERYADVVEVNGYSNAEVLQHACADSRYDVTIADVNLPDTFTLPATHVTLLLWDGATALPDSAAQNGLVIKKYQRISKIIALALEKYASVASDVAGMHDSGEIAAFWSPAGGCGKTTVAMAYAAKKADTCKKVIYINLEPFSSTDAFFDGESKSISRVFEHLEGNLQILLQSLWTEDRASGVFYYGKPENYDDINVLTPDDVHMLLCACANVADAVIVDCGNMCGQKTKVVFDLAQQIHVVMDGTLCGQRKWDQFCTQNNIFEDIREKVTVVRNRGAAVSALYGVGRTVALPVVDSTDPKVVYKRLSQLF